MASGWIKSLQCKSRAFEDVYHPNPKNLISSSSCRSSYRSIKDVVETTKKLPRSSRKPEPDLSNPPPRPRRSSSTRTLTELPEGHPSRNVMEIIFHTSWSPETFTGRIEMVFKVQSWPRMVTRFEEYRETVKARSRSGSGCSGSGDEENARCLADGNEVMRFRCLGPTSGDCGMNDTWMFSGGKGTEVCTYAGSSGAHESAGGGRGRRSMLVCRVIAGRVSKRMGFGYESLMDGRATFDSVSGDNGELLVFDPRAVLPCFLIIYKLLVSKGCKLVGCGSAVPSLSVSNDDLAKIVDTSDEWISVRTGIRNRRIISGKENLKNPAVEVARKALKMADVEPDDLDMILMCTSTPEDIFGDAPKVQRELGCTKSQLAHDITAACSGFVMGLFSASCCIRGGGLRNVLVIGADVISRFVDWTDRGTCILFGDGAVVVQACDADEDGLLSFDLHSDGEGASYDTPTLLLKTSRCPINDNEINDLLGSNGPALEFPPKWSSYACIQMNGKEVFHFAVRCVPQSIESALEKAVLKASDVHWLLLHQANQRIIDAVATRQEFPPEKVLSNPANYDNTSAASIPLALDEAVRSRKVKPGRTIVTSGFGAGLT